MHPILYSFRRCPYAMRARLALAQVGAAVELREVKLAAKPEALRLASPKATVPVLVLPSGAVLEQSLEIMRWAGAWPGEDAALIAQNDGAFKQALDAYKYPEKSPELTPGQRFAGVADFLAVLEARLSAQPHLSGERSGFTDAAIFPFVRQCQAVNPAAFAHQPYPHLQHWLAKWLASPLFHAVMGKYAPWQQGDEPVVFGAGCAA